MDNNNIILIGMPAGGKSTVGVILAKTLGMDFIDTDLLICRREKSTLQMILDKKGLDAFLLIEQEVLATLRCSDSVVATGGSAVLSDRAMGRLSGLGTLIFLDVPYGELASRLTNIKTRGIAFAPGQDLLSVYNERVPKYRRWAELTVPAGGRSPERVVERIVEALNCG